MMSTKKLLSLIILTAILAGCGAGNTAAPPAADTSAAAKTDSAAASPSPSESSEAPAEKSAAADTAAADTAAAGNAATVSEAAEIKALQDYPDVYKMSQFLALGTVAPPDPVNNLYAKYVRDVLKIDVSESQYVGVTDPNAMLEKIGLFVASNDMPEVITMGWSALARDVVQQFVDAGMIIDVENYIRNDMPNVLQDMNDEILDTYRMNDGKIYGIPGQTVNPDNKTTEYSIEPNLTMVKRTDLWEAVGVTENPKTPEDYYQVLKKLKDAYPTMNGQQFYPFHGLLAGDDVDWLFSAMFGAYTHLYMEKAPGEERYIDMRETPAYLDYLKYTSKLYREGLVDPELFINSYDVDYTRVQEGRVGSTIMWPNDISKQQGGLQKTDPKGKLNAFPLPRVAGLDKTEYWHVNALGGQVSIISKKTRDIGRVIKYMDWEASRDGWIMNCWGGPGKDANEGYFHFNENGDPMYNTEFLDKKLQEDPTYQATCGGWSYFNVYRVLYHPNYLGFVNLTEPVNPLRMEARGYNMPEVNLNIEYDKYTAMPNGPVEQAKTEAVQKVLKDSKATIVTTAKSDQEVETMYNKFISDLKAAGMVDIGLERYQRWQQYKAGTLKN